MSFPMPPTAPPKRAPFDMARVPPEIQARLAAGEAVPFDDGVTLYPDGTYEPGDTSGYVSPDSFDMGAGGFNGSPQMTGMPPTAPTDPMGGAQFDRYFATANAGMPPTSPGGEGQAIANPMGEAGFPDPFAQMPATKPERSVNLTVEAPDTPQLGGEDEKSGSRTMPGRLGRRMSGTAKPSGRAIGSRRRR